MDQQMGCGSVGSFRGPGDNKALGMQSLTSILFGHAAFQFLHAGCKLGVFEVLAEKPGVTADELTQLVALSMRAAQCLLLGLTSLGLLEKGDDGLYRNGPLVTRLVEDGRWSLVSDTARFEAEIVYPGLDNFADSLRADTNLGLKHVEGRGDLYWRLVMSPRLEETFFRYMSSWSRAAVPHLLEHFDFGNCRRVFDAGCGDGTNAIAIAQANPNLRMVLFDIPATAGIARSNVRKAGLDDRLEVTSGDLFSSELPYDCDCVLLIHQLVIWPMDTNLVLLSRVHDVLPPKGRVVIFSSISSDDGRGPLMAALDSAYFVAVPHEGGMIHSWSEYRDCLTKAGFRDIRCTPCESWTPHGLVVATA
jgi:SAM-dependent methyltransferase